MTAAERGSGAGEPFARLRRVLEHEARLGFADRAVYGGVEQFAARWAGEQAAEYGHAARAVLEALAGYAGRDAAGRRAAVERVLRIDPPSPLPAASPRPRVEARPGDAACADRADEAGDIRPPLPRSAQAAPPGAPRASDPPGRPEPRPLTETLDGDDAPIGGARVVSPNGSPETPMVGPRHRPNPGSGESADLPSARPTRARSARPVSRAAAPTEAAVDSAPAGESATGPLDAPVERSIKGIGPEHAKHLQKLGVQTVRDLLYHFPRRHLDYRNSRLIKDLTFDGFETILVNVWKVTAEPRGGIFVIRAIVADDSGTAEATWVRRKDFISRELPVGKTIVLSGECRLIAGRPVFRDPDWESFSGEDTVHTARLVPVYPLVEGLGARYLRRIVKQAVDRYVALVQDHLPAGLRADLHLMDLPQAIAQAHFPDSAELKAAAQRRLAFDELLVIQLGVLWRRRAWDRDQTAPALSAGDEALRVFLAQLPFQLTAAQTEALADLRRRLARPIPMSLLLEGDVGSGKTVVATAAMVLAAAQGYQSALMAPTELLAEQHLKTVERLVAGLGADRPRVALLTGALKASERRERYRAIADGGVDLVIGTQALVQEGLRFARLGLVVVDEQHRFGVAQRTTLRQKGYNPHVLVMTATPIPRTLALTIHGDLDLVVIDELPPGRQPIKTRHLAPSMRPRAYEFVRREVRKGHQAFVICPLVEESERVEARAATEEHRRLSEEVFPDLRLGLLHGRMKPSEKDEVMLRFQAREFDILVSTAVVEVGIDVPNATVMLVEGANRFGLAQLHQFRGRVGRGTAESYCLLISDSPSAASDGRLAIMERSRNGFELAEKDLELRGPGEFFGTRQSGLPDLKMARLSDGPLLIQARDAAMRTLAEDPRLTAPEHRLLRSKVAGFWQNQIDLN